MHYPGWSDVPRGVQVKSLTPDGSDITIFYDGLLSKSGASEVYLHAGFGNPMHWQTVDDYRMQHTGQGWKKTLNMEDKKLTFCFRDSSHNWDNNSGYNWSYSIGQ